MNKLKHLLTGLLIVTLSSCNVNTSESEQQSESEVLSEIVSEETSSEITAEPSEVISESTVKPSSEPTEQPSSESTEEPSEVPSESISEPTPVDPTDEPSESAPESPSVSEPEQPVEDEQLTKLKEIFGEDITYYDADTPNPYNIDVSKYGNDVKVIFYEDKLDEVIDPYTNVSKTSFYKDYTKATSYEDAYYRSKHGLMSGDIEPQDYLPISLGIKNNDKYVRFSTATYVLSPDGDYLAYVENNFTEFNIIYFCGAYTSLNEVGAYLLAFGDVPVNSNYHKSKGKSDCISTWGEYGRLNNSTFSGNTSKYPYEPLLPTITSVTFHETDFGTQGNYTLKNDDLGTVYNQSVYNDGKYITRGAARFVFTYDKSVTKIDDRYVFYTYNHYNDFQEYLNSHDGWGKRFGNESAGNGYCYNTTDYNNSNKYPVSRYPATVISEFFK